jgi:hypothetical protein
VKDKFDKEKAKKLLETGIREASSGHISVEDYVSVGDIVDATQEHDAYCDVSAIITGDAIRHYRVYENGAVETR